MKLNTPTKIRQKESFLQHIIRLQPPPDPLMLCLAFGFRITEDLLKLRFIPDIVKKWEGLQGPDEEQGAFIIVWIFKLRLCA